MKRYRIAYYQTASDREYRKVHVSAYTIDEAIAKAKKWYTVAYIKYAHTVEQDAR